MRPTKAVLVMLCALSAACSADTDGMTDNGQTRGSDYAVVIKVAADDHLNIRAQPTGKASIVGQIPPGGTVLKLGEADGWHNIVYRGQLGWVYGKYLGTSAAPDFTAINDDGLNCFGTEPHWQFKTLGNAADYGMYGESQRFVLDTAIVPAMMEQNYWYATLYAAPANDNAAPAQLTALFKTEQCSDGMSDNDYPQSIQLINASGDLLKGCCR